VAGDASLWKRYSQAKLATMREALAKLDRTPTSTRGFLERQGPISRLLEQFWNTCGIFYGYEKWEQLEAEGFSWRGRRDSNPRPHA
jgi:hypothetical protein